MFPLLRIYFSNDHNIYIKHLNVNLLSLLFLIATNFENRSDIRKWANSRRWKRSYRLSLGDTSSVAVKLSIKVLNVK